MNTRKYKTILALLNTVYGSLVIYTIIITYLFFIGESEYALPSAFLLIIPVLSYYLEQHAKHLFTFILGHTIPAIILYTLPKQPIIKIIYVLFTVTVMLYHLYRRVKQKPLMQNIRSYTYLLVLIIMQLYANWKEYSQLSRMIQIITLLCAVIYFTLIYLYNFTDFFANHVENTNINFHQIKRINNRFIIVFISVTTAIMIGAFSVPAGKILSVLKTIFTFLIRILFFWVKKSDDKMEIEDIKKSTPNMGQIIQADQAEANHVWLFIQEILIYLCVTVIILASTALVIYGLYQLYKYFHSTKADETEKKEFISPFHKETRIKKIRKINKARLPHIFPNNNEKIRRYFYQLIIKKCKDKVPSNLTAEELLNLPVQTIGLLSSAEPEKNDPILLELYHKARYSNEMCSKEEVNIAKGIIRGMKNEFKSK